VLTDVRGLRKKGDAMTEARVTVREVVRLLLEADSYPRLGNEDWPVAARMEAAALEKAATAVASPHDPPEFRGWLEALQKGATSRSTSARKSTGRSTTILTSKHRVRLGSPI
jgi:hypothetical protein